MTTGGCAYFFFSIMKDLMVEEEEKEEEEKERKHNTTKEYLQKIAIRFPAFVKTRVSRQPPPRVLCPFTRRIICCCASSCSSGSLESTQVKSASLVGSVAAGTQLACSRHEFCDTGQRGTENGISVTSAACSCP